MKKPAKLKRLVGKPLELRYLAASADQRDALRSVIETERDWRINRMRKKGFLLEATVADVFGLFTRGPATGTVTLVSEPVSEAALS